MAIDVEIKRKVDVRFGWKAIYADGTCLEQFPRNAPETNFRAVLDRGMPEMFYVGSEYGVDLKSGEFLIAGRVQRFGNLDAVPHVPYELVYFRRNQVELKSDGTQGEHQVWHFVGYKHSAGQVALCIPGDGGPMTICVGAK